jgi:menaquinone-dependent protoporphyrinogen IX oxidase
MKTVVIYKSRTGHTKQYAEWISEALQAELYEASYMTVDKLREYDTIIFGGNLHAVGIDGAKLITKNLKKLDGKRIIMFADGLSVPNESIRNEVLKNNFTAAEQSRIEFYYFRGGFDRAKLGAADKFLMSLLKRKIDKKKRTGGELAADEKGMLAVWDKPTDFANKKYIEPLVASVKVAEDSK